MADWDPYRARQIGQDWRIARYDAGDWPSVKSVRNHFGRLSDAVVAAGLVPRRQGQQRQRPELSLDEATLLQLAHLSTIRARRDPADVMAGAIRNVASARRSGEAGDLQVALIELAAAALGWARSAMEATDHSGTRPAAPISSTKASVPWERDERAARDL
jgi:hypothetical protein